MTINVQEARVLTGRNNRSVRPLIATGVAAALFLIPAAGCGEATKTAATAPTPGLRAVQGVGLEDAIADVSNVRPPNVGAVTEPSPDDIAAQFEQDMAALEALRSGPPAEIASGTPPNATAARPRPQVMFNEPASLAPQTGADTGQTRVEAGDDAETAPPLDPARAELAQSVADQSASPEARLAEVLVSLRRELYQDASYADSPLRQYLVMAALSMVDPDRAIDPDAFHDLSERERELLRAYQDFFLKLGGELRESGDEQALVNHLDGLRQQLLNRGPLKIARAELCTRVDGFGRFATFDKYAFLAGRSQEAVIYTEIEEFTSEQNEKGEWVTDLWQELVIYSTNDNVPVWHQEWQPASDIASRKRTDFYISHLITLPPRLTVGGYVLKIRVRDERSGSIAENGIRFTIVADPNMAAKVR